MINAFSRLNKSFHVDFADDKQYKKDASQTPGEHNSADFSG